MKWGTSFGPFSHGVTSTLFAVKSILLLSSLKKKGGAFSFLASRNQVHLTSIKTCGDSLYLVICRQLYTDKSTGKRMGSGNDVITFRWAIRRSKPAALRVGAAGSNSPTETRAQASCFYFEPMLTLSLVVGSLCVEASGWGGKETIFLVTLLRTAR